MGCWQNAKHKVEVRKKDGRAGEKGPGHKGSDWYNTQAKIQQWRNPRGPQCLVGVNLQLKDEKLRRTETNLGSLHDTYHLGCLAFCYGESWEAGQRNHQYPEISDLKEPSSQLLLTVFREMGANETGREHFCHSVSSTLECLISTLLPVSSCLSRRSTDWTCERYWTLWSRPTHSWLAAEWAFKNRIQAREMEWGTLFPESLQIFARN